jgi:hypothetical protein
VAHVLFLTTPSDGAASCPSKVSKSVSMDTVSIIFDIMVLPATDITTKLPFSLSSEAADATSPLKSFFLVA